MSQDNFEDLFEISTMVSMVERFGSSVDNTPASDLFAAEADRLAPEGHSADWDEVRYTRGLAPTTGSGTPSKATTLPKITPKSAVMVDVKEHIDLPASVLYFMRNPGSDGASAQAAVARALKTLAIRVENSKEYMACKTLEGALDFATMPNSDFTHTLTFPVQARAEGAPWSTIGTKIRSNELRVMKSNFKRDAGFKLQRIMCPEIVEEYLVQNTEIQTFATESMGAQVLTNPGRPGDSGWVRGIGNLDWKFSDSYYATDAAEDTPVDFQTAGTLLLMGAAGSGGLALAEGKSYIPAGPVFSDGGAGALSMLKEVRGSYAYAELITNAPGIRLHVGWKGLYLLKQTDAVTKFTIT